MTKYTQFSKPVGKIGEEMAQTYIRHISQTRIRTFFYNGVASSNYVIKKTGLFIRFFIKIALNLNNGKSNIKQLFQHPASPKPKFLVMSIGLTPIAVS